MIRVYRVREIFNVKTIGADKALNAIKLELEDDPYKVILTTWGNDRYVEVFERMIRFAMERIRLVRLDMPYKRIPKRLVIEIVHFLIILLNSIPREREVFTKTYHPGK